MNEFTPEYFSELDQLVAADRRKRAQRDRWSVNLFWLFIAFAVIGALAGRW